MTVITTRVTVGSDGAISVVAPLPAGEYEAELTAAAPRRRPGGLDLPVHDGPWDDSIPLRREDMYGDHGR